MKLISLNTWCGIKYELLKNFLEQQAKDVDIFCFQEVRNGDYSNSGGNISERVTLFDDFKNILSEFTGYFTEMVTGVGMAVFVRNTIEVKEIKSRQILSIQDQKNLVLPDGFVCYPRIAQSIYLKERNLAIHNFHGLPGNHKKDMPERDLQAKRLLEIMDDNNSQIIVGDFNLNIDTQAIAQLGSGRQNLIKDFGIKTTRNSNYGRFETLPFADYAFLSKDIEVNDFKALPDEVSDHLALFLDFK
jgi:endonuclease/exonuclease/phosphatase family metal-dependent hydrolase